MEQLKLEWSLDVHIESLEYVTVWGEAHPPVQEVLPRIEPHIDALEKAKKRERKVELRRRAAVALEEVRDAKVDAIVAGLARDALAAFEHRDAPAYKLLFRENPSDAMRPVGGQEQANYVEGLLARIEDGADYKPFLPRAKELRKAQVALEAATAEKNKRMTEEALFKAERDMVKEAAAKEYRLIYHELKLKFSDDPDVVEMFFMRFSKPTKKPE